jgi:hypothetical protein
MQHFPVARDRDGHPRDKVEAHELSDHTIHCCEFGIGWSSSRGEKSCGR